MTSPAQAQYGSYTPPHAGQTLAHTGIDLTWVLTAGSLLLLAGCFILYFWGLRREPS